MAIDSFILYKSQCSNILKLTDLEAGVFFKNLLNYQINGKIPEFQSTFEEIIWNLFQNQFEVDAKKWDESKLRSSEYGVKGGLKSAEIRRQKKATLQNNQGGVENNQQSLENFKLNVNDNVNVNVNENENKNENINENDLIFGTFKKTDKLPPEKENTWFPSKIERTEEETKVFNKKILEQWENKRLGLSK
jgi:hypothetical protein